MGTRITVASSQKSLNYSERFGLQPTSSFRQFKIPNNIQLNLGRYKFSSNNLSAGSIVSLGGNSVVFSGAGYMETASSAVLALDAAFTIEVWTKISTTQAYQTVYELGLYTNGILYRPGNQDNNGGVWINGSQYVTGSQIPETVGSWRHMAICRNASNVMSIFFNGTRVWTSTISGTVNSGNAPIRMGGSRHTSGQYFYGNISQCRIVKGSTVYDPTQTTITIPTATLTSITNTTAFLCQASSTLTDLGPNNLSITTGGTAPTVSSDDPFNSVDVVVGLSNTYSEMTINNANTVYINTKTENARFSINSVIQRRYTNDLILDKNITRTTVQTNDTRQPYNYRQLVINSGNYNTIVTRRGVTSNVTIGTGGGTSGPTQIWF